MTNNPISRARRWFDRRAVRRFQVPVPRPEGPIEADTKRALTLRPEVGTRVVLLKASWYLKEQFGAEVGSTGQIVAHSRLNPDDSGVLIDWGSGSAVRCDLTELSLAN